MSKPTLAEYLAEVKARCEKATKGPWEAEGSWIAAPVEGGRPNGEVIGRMEGSADQLSPAQRMANAELAAHSRTDVEALAKMVKRIQEIIEAHTRDSYESAGLSADARQSEAVRRWNDRGVEAQSILAEFHEELEPFIPEEKP